MTLNELALKHGTDKAESQHGYCRVYETLFETYRKWHAFEMLEIGVQYGFSINMWLDYFENAQVYGLDSDNGFKCDNPRYHFLQGDQGSRKFWRELDKDLTFNLIIDDGSHNTSDVIISFENLWHRLKAGGLYIIEDSLTFYHTFYRTDAHTQTWFQSFVDAVNAGGKLLYGWPDEQPSKPLSDLEQTIESVQFHKGLVIIKKRSINGEMAS